jgi:prophage maintenance system killer protein
VKFLTKRFVIAYQARLIDLFGGSHGLRDEGLLDSALAFAVVMGAFLSIDGHPARFDEAELYLTIMAVAEGRLDKAGLADRLRRAFGA